MTSLKCYFVFNILIAISLGKVVNVRNEHSTAIVVSANGTEYTVATKELVVIPSTDEWSGTISAVPVGVEVTNGPKTKAEISLSANGDSYSVSLVEGFNLGIKVVPTSPSSCNVAVCTANLLKVCPAANQVTNSFGAVVACINSPTVMSELCPLAIVDEATSVNVQTCADSTSYLVIFT